MDTELDESGWRLRRWIFNIALCLWFFALYFFGPNVILFGRLNGLTTADFVPMVKQNLAKIVRDMKEYESLNGTRPWSADDLYGNPPSGIRNEYAVEGINAGEFELRDRFGIIKYNFTPGSEGWEVRGPFVAGRIPVPPVALDTPTPTSHP